MPPESQTAGHITLTDDSGTEIDRDVFDELVKSGVLNFKVTIGQPVMGKNKWLIVSFILNHVN